MKITWWFANLSRFIDNLACLSDDGEIRQYLYREIPSGFGRKKGK